MKSVSRRTFFRSAGLTGAVAVASACGPAAAPAGQSQSAGVTAQGTWEKEWDDLIAAAKMEGKLVLETLPGTGFRQLADAFEAAFPGIKVDQNAAAASTWAPKALQERKAGVYEWDIAQIPTITGFSVFPEGIFDPLRPVLFRPDVLDDTVWRGGLDFGFMDDDKKWVFLMGWNLGTPLWINTDLVQEAEIKSSKDLLEPKWKGKIASFDPRTGGFSASPMTAMRLKHGDDVIKRLYGDQEAAISRDPRQLAEFVLRGRYPIGIGINSPVVDDFRTEGLAKNMKALYLEDFSTLGGEYIWLVNRAPHPNVAKLYINWLLSQKGQEVFTKTVGTNSRRSDVPPADPQTFPPEGAEKRFLSLGTQKMWPEVDKTRDLALAVLK